MKRISKIKNPSFISILFYLTAFLISALGFLLILKSRGYYPFKDTTLLVLDAKDQYFPFLGSLRYVLGTENSPFFSWSRSMGGNYIGVYAYYIASPLSFLTLLFPIEKLHLAFTLLTVLKIGLCSLSFAVFSSYLWKKTHITSDSNNYTYRIAWQQFILLPFAIAYSLMSYNIVYSQCLTWLDGIILLPLILLGIEKIIEGKRGLLYYLFILTMFISNFYISYIIGIFTVIYLFYRLFCNMHSLSVSQKGTIISRFAITSLLAIGTATPILLPVIHDLNTGKLTATPYGTGGTTNFYFPDIITKLTNGSFDSLTNEALPYIYCGYLAIVMALVFFLLPKISLREKLGAAAIILIMLTSFYYTNIDLFWHGFQRPNSFPYRYSFLFSFFLLYLGTKATCILPLGKISTIWEKKPLFELITLIFLLITAIDMGFNGRSLLYQLGWQIAHANVAEYTDFIDGTKPLITQIQEEDESFYRINQNYEFSKNDAMILGYNGMTHYSSTYNAAINAFTHSLGMAHGSIWNTGYGSTPLTDSLLSIKYILATKPVPTFYTPMATTDFQTASYKNTSALPIAFSAPATSLNPDLTNADPFTNQNALLNAIAGTSHSFFTQYEYESSQNGLNKTYSFTTDSDNPVYLYMYGNCLDYNTKVFVNGNEVGQYFTSETNCNLYLGTFPAGTIVHVEVVPSIEIDIRQCFIAQLHTELLSDTLNNLQYGGIKLTNYKGGNISGTLTVQENETIITSIPYDSGWTIKIDGKEVESISFADTLLAIKTTAGEHSITFSYVSPGFTTGICICLISIVIAILYFCRTKLAKAKT